MKKHTLNIKLKRQENELANGGSNIFAQNKSLCSFWLMAAGLTDYFVLQCKISNYFPGTDGGTFVSPHCNSSNSYYTTSNIFDLYGVI